MFFGLDRVLKVSRKYQKPRRHFLLLAFKQGARAPTRTPCNEGFFYRSDCPHHDTFRNLLIPGPTQRIGRVLLLKDEDEEYGEGEEVEAEPVELDALDKVKHDFNGEDA